MLTRLGNLDVTLALVFQILIKIYLRFGRQSFVIATKRLTLNTRFVLGPLERSCTPVIIPFCKNIGYTHTMITLQRQKTIYKHMYRKNYTNDANVAIPARNSGAERLLNITKSLTAGCAVNVKKLFCAEYFPPCFQKEGLAYYTACKDVCRNLSSQCPKVFNTRLRFFFYCEKLAYGESYNGFCKHTSWPRPMQWIDIFRGKCLVY